jgi:type II secretion system protein G
MLNRLRNRQRGFTLIELLIVIAIIGIIAALLIPNFLDALQKAKQKRTMADMRNIGTAMFSWLTDQVGAAAAGAAATPSMYDLGGLSAAKKDAGALSALLVTRYVQEIPALDGWKNTYDYYLNDVDPLAVQVMAIRSLGRDGTAIGDDYEVTAFTPTDYDQDIVWADGFFVRWPQKFTK